MAVKLLDTEHLGGTAFYLQFQIDKLGENEHIDGQIFDIHGLAQMKFFIQNTKDNKSEILFSAMKQELTMIVEVEMKVSCDKPQFDCSFTCKETWSEYISLFKSPYTSKMTFDLEVTINVTSRKSTLDIMYMDEDFTDFQLATSEGNVAVHRACLASHSDVFKRMLCGEWKETSAGRIEIQGVTLQTLQDLKRYMYLGTLPEDGLCPLLRIATFYLIDNLRVECTIKLAHSVDSGNLYDLLEFSYANYVPELTFAILTTLRAQPRDVIVAAQKQQRAVKPKQKSKNVNEKNEPVSVEKNGSTSEETTSK